MEDDRPSLFRHRFGSAEFDEGRFELRVGGLVVEVQQKPLQLLALLLATPGEVVGKEQIFETVWNGRATGDAVLANAVSKLRSALGADNAERLVTVPRQGYRLAGPVERTAVGRRQASRMDFAAGAAVPRRENFVLVRQLGGSAAAETWLARHARTGERRVYKFAVDGERLAELKREVTLYRVLREALGERPDIARILDWQFDEAPYFLECADDGTSLDAWADEAEGDTTRLAALPANERLALALQVIDAVAAAITCSRSSVLSASTTSICSASSRFVRRSARYSAAAATAPTMSAAPAANIHGRRARLRASAAWARCACSAACCCAARSARRVSSERSRSASSAAEPRRCSGSRSVARAMSSRSCSSATSRSQPGAGMRFRSAHSSW